MLFRKSKKVKELEKKVEDLTQLIWVQNTYISKLECRLDDAKYCESRTRIKELEVELEKLCEILQSQEIMLQSYQNELDKLRVKYDVPFDESNFLTD